jgi:hypothetical protein
MYNNTISGTATEKGGNDNIITVKNYMYYNAISGTATEKGGNDNIITVYTACTIILSLAQQVKKEVMII